MSDRHGAPAPRTSYIATRGRPVFLILAAANGIAGLSGARSFLYVALGCFIAWVATVVFDHS